MTTEQTPPAPPEDDIEALISTSETIADDLGDSNDDGDARLDQADQPEAEVETPEVVPSEPPVEPAPAQAPPATPTPVDQTQQIRNLQLQNQQYQHQAQAAQMDRAQRETAQDFIETGIPEDQAQMLAQQMRGIVEQVGQDRQQSQVEQAGMQARHNAAIYYAKQSGLGLDDLAALEGLPDVASIQRAANDRKEIRDLKKEVAEMKQATVPIQTFDNGQASPQAATSNSRDLDRYNSGATDAKAIAAGARAAGQG